MLTFVKICEMKKLAKYALFALAVVSATACFNEKKVYNRSTVSEKHGKMLLGRQTRDQLKQEPFNAWYEEEYKNYEYDPQTIKEVQKKNLTSHNIIVFFGTWCGDSHREVPRLLKILDAVKYPEQRLTLVAVNRKKETPDGEDVPYNIKRVPTIIVQNKYGKEV